MIRYKKKRDLDPKVIIKETLSTSQYDGVLGQAKRPYFLQHTVPTHMLSKDCGGESAWPAFSPDYVYDLPL